MLTAIMFIVVIIISLTIAYINGMHDGGTIVATAITSRLTTPMKVIVLAGTANFLGAILLGTSVVSTIYEGVVYPATILSGPQDKSYMFLLAALLGSAVWNLFTWFVKLPSSASHSLIGAMMGSDIAYMGLYSVVWPSVYLKVILAMIISPLIGFVFGFIFYKAEMRGLRYGTSKLDKHVHTLHLLSTFFLSLSYGSNDSQKIMGVILLALTVKEGTAVSLPVWAIILSGLVLAIGTISGGYNMIRTVGFDITKINVKKSFASQFAAFFVTTAANFTGLPISATQVVTATVAGAGTGESARGVHWPIMSKILISWLVTIPCSLAVGFVLFQILTWSL